MVINISKLTLKQYYYLIVVFEPITSVCCSLSTYRGYCYHWCRRAEGSGFPERTCLSSLWAVESTKARQIDAVSISLKVSGTYKRE